MYTRMTEYSVLEKLRQKFARSTSESTEIFLRDGRNAFYFRNLMGDELGAVPSSWELLDCDFPSIK